MKGSCLCGSVTYAVEPPFRVFQYCHCRRCQKITGSAHASNIFVNPTQFRWLTGEEWVSRYEAPNTKYFAICFCKKCGSNLPWLVQGGSNLVIPAGSLDEDPKLRPQQIIYWESKACWYIEPGEMLKHNQLPPKKVK